MTGFGRATVAAVGFGGSFLVSLLVFRPESAHAAWERLAGVACGIEKGMYRLDTLAVYNDQPGRGYAYCPITDDNDHPKQNVTTLNVHVIDNSTVNNAYAYACISYWNSQGGECGSPDSSGVSFTGADTLTPSLSKWTSANSAHFGFVEVTLPAKTTNPSSFSGIYRVE